MPATEYLKALHKKLKALETDATMEAWDEVYDNAETEKIDRASSILGQAAREVELLLRGTK